MGSVTADLQSDEFDGLSTAARAVWLILRADGPMTRNELASAADLHPSTVSNVVAELKQHGVVGQQTAPRGSTSHFQFFARDP